MRHRPAAARGVFFNVGNAGIGLLDTGRDRCADFAGMAKLAVIHGLSDRCHRPCSFLERWNTGGVRPRPAHHIRPAPVALRARRETMKPERIQGIETDDRQTNAESNPPPIHVTLTIHVVVNGEEVSA